MSLFPSCREVQERIARCPEGSGAPWTRIVIRFHLLVCRPCEVLQRTLAAVPVLARRLLMEEDGTNPPPPEEARAALAGAIRIIEARRKPTGRAGDGGPAA